MRVSTLTVSEAKHLLHGMFDSLFGPLKHRVGFAQDAKNVLMNGVGELVGSVVLQLLPETPTPTVDEIEKTILDIAQSALYCAVHWAYPETVNYTKSLSLVENEDKLMSFPETSPFKFKFDSRGIWQLSLGSSILIAHGEAPSEVEALTVVRDWFINQLKLVEQSLEKAKAKEGQ